MAYDAARGVSVLFGGYAAGYASDTWEWDGSEWTLRVVAGPSPRIGHAMAYDSARGVTVLFGGDRFGETWEWDGTMWMKRAPAAAPSRRTSLSMTYDVARGVTVLFGGYTTTYNGETWEWNGTAWVQRLIAGPLPRFYPAMAYDTQREVSVLFGGVPYSGVSGETWELGGACLSPAMVSDPVGAYGCIGGESSFTVQVSGSGPFTYQWRVDGVEIDPELNPSAALQTLTLRRLTGLETGLYECVIDNACGSVTSAAAALAICPGDFNCDGGVDGLDIDAFFAAWEAGLFEADINVDGGVDGPDVGAFFERWEAGC
jgi:hypothetical protein